jgi:hypothetical protein
MDVSVLLNELCHVEVWVNAVAAEDGPFISLGAPWIALHARSQQLRLEI